MPPIDSEELCERVVTLEEIARTLTASHEKITKELGDIKGLLTKYQGVAGGVALTVSFIGVAWGFLKDYIQAHWH